MINTSLAYKKAVRQNREFRIRDRITFRDGTQADLTLDDVLSYSINEATSSTGKFEIGAAVIKEYKISINNMDGRFDLVDFYDADITAVVGLHLPNGTWEELQKGTYRIVRAVAKELAIDVTAYDDMLFFDQPYQDSTLSYPATVSEIVRDACMHCQVPFDASTVEMSNYTVKARPDDSALTFRDIISYCAQIMGCYAKINVLGQLSFGWYDFHALEDTREIVYDGGSFDWKQKEDTLDGGKFSPWNNGDTADGGNFTDMGRYHHFYDLTSKSIHTDDIRITGILVTASGDGQENESFLCGQEGYVLDLSGNPLIQEGAAQEVAEYVGGKIVGNMFRPLNISCQSDPCVEAGDAAYVTDRRNRTYKTVITNTTFVLGGVQKVECAAELPSEKNYKKYGAVTKLVAKERKQTEHQFSAYELEARRFGALMAHSMGLYETYETLDDGSQVKYQHEKPSLSESKVIWKQTRDAFAVSTDGGKTWNGGMDTGGNVLASVLSAIGINAEWINTGELLVRDGKGNVTLLANVNTGRVLINAESISITGKAASTQEYANAQANSALSSATAYANAAVANQTQTDIFNKLTSNGALKGIFMKDGELYINATYLLTGILTDDVGKNFWNLETGEFSLKSCQMKIEAVTDDEYPIYVERTRGVRLCRTLSGAGGFYFTVDEGIKTGTYMKIAFVEDAIVLEGGSYQDADYEGTPSAGGGDVWTATDSGDPEYMWRKNRKMSLASDGQFKSEWTYKNTQSGSANVHVNSSGFFYRHASSSRRYKMDESTDLGDINPHGLYKVPIKVFRYRPGYLMEGDPWEGKLVLGFIVEDMLEMFPQAVQYEDGLPEMWNDKVMIPAMLKLIQEQHEEIEALKARVARLEQAIGKDGV